MNLLKNLKNLLSNKPYKPAEEPVMLTSGVRMTPHKYTLADWNKALKMKDSAKMQLILETTSEACAFKNSNCLTEVFCPECPMGLLCVRTGRECIK